MKPRNLQVRLPVPCAVGAHHCLSLQVSAQGQIQRIKVNCAATDAEVVIMRACGEKTCLDAMAWLKKQFTLDNYIAGYHVSGEFPESAPISESLALWIRNARQARTSRARPGQPVSSKVVRQAALISRQLPHTLAGQPIAEFRYYSRTGAYQGWGSYAALELCGVTVASVCRMPGQPSFAVWNHRADFAAHMRRGDGRDACLLCDTTATRAHRESPKHIKRVRALAAQLLGALQIPLLDFGVAREVYGHDF